MQDGGEAITFNNDEELKTFIAANVITTMEAAAILNCSRQSVDQSVKGGRLKPLKQTLRDKLFWKPDVLAKVKVNIK